MTEQEVKDRIAEIVSEIPKEIKQSEKHPDENCSIVLGNCYDRQVTTEIVKRYNSHDALLTACEGLMEEADNGSARFDDPVPGSIFTKAEQAIAEAKS